MESRHPGGLMCVAGRLKICRRPDTGGREGGTRADVHGRTRLCCVCAEWLCVGQGPDVGLPDSRIRLLHR